MGRLGEASGIVRQMQDLQSEVCLPFIFEDRLIGICNLGSRPEGKGYSKSELFMLQTLSANASIAFENARLFQEVGRYVEQLGAVSQAINLSPDVDPVFDLLTKEIQKYAPFDWASIAIYEEEGKVYFYRAKGWKGETLPENYTWPLTDLNVLSRLMMQQEPLIQADLFSESVPENERKLSQIGVRSYLILPLWVRGKLIGTLNLWSMSLMERPAQALEFVIPLTNHLAPFLEVARLFEEMKKANEALREKSLELETSQLNQARFFSFVTHELRTPLNAIMGYLSLILNGTYGPIDPKQASAIHRIKENSDVLNYLINDLLDLARLESGKISIQLEEVDLSRLLRDLMANMEPLFLQKKINILLDIAYTGSLYSDYSKIRQILQNLLSNSIKFTEGGFIRIATYFIPERDGILIEISDSGRGIDPHDLSHIFEPFWQAKPDASGQIKGSGPGLTIVKKNVEILKGQISVSSVQERGTTFTLFSLVNILKINGRLHKLMGMGLLLLQH